MSPRIDSLAPAERARVVAGVDTSTQSTTVVLRDAESGAVLTSASAPHPATFPPLSEQDPAAWWDALVLAFSRAREAAGVDPEQIVAVSVAGQCHGLVALDSAGAVIRPAKLWNDTTSAPDAEHLRELLAPSEWITRTGTVVNAAFTISKIAWFKRTEPAAYARLATVLLPHDWITFRLTGAFVTDRSEASGTGYFDAQRNVYDYDLLALVDAERDWTTALPAVLGPEQLAGTVTPEAALALGISPLAVVGPGAGDQHAGAVGLGARPGDAVVVLGTSGVVYTVTEDPATEAEGIVNRVADAAGGFQPLICTLNAAKVTDTVARILGVDHDELGRLALESRRREDRAVFATYLDGERTPDLPNARGVLSGIDAELDRGEFALAAYEGVIFGLVRGMRRIERLGINLGERLIVIGGGAASPAYRQVLADLTGRPVLLPDEREVVGMGAAVQAAAVLHGTTIAAQRERWAPGLHEAALPRPDSTLDAVWNRYLTTADWRGADRPATA
ncbi:xylulokinase [Mycetocola tolaasinivorans]|uniref:Xylulose kinase n=1 Tax=Mycetocola tolaasinivorans TaxID=76635 RepID=A0A3L7A877_9MICO|nr:xylulokinase [Mycetocola tolaasinivorans]RLP75572.1 xylulokinase [Mycetocola tolaasinivorans]